MTPDETMFQELTPLMDAKNAITDAIEHGDIDLAVDIIGDDLIARLYFTLLASQNPMPQPRAYADHTRQQKTKDDDAVYDPGGRRWA